MTVTVRLGEYTFEDTELPQRINAGGNQLHALHQLIGGKRIVDAMGPSDDVITWSGLSRGLEALERMSYIDTIRRVGQLVPFSYSQFSYQVLISSFQYVIVRPHWVEFTVSLLVIEDLVQPVNTIFPSGFADAITDDIAEAIALGDLITYEGVAGAVTSLAAIIQNIPDLNNATATDLNSILSQVNVTQGIVTEGINFASKIL